MNDKITMHSGAIYVAGPISGIPEHNIPAFKAATARLRAAGYEVVCPTEVHRSLEEMLANTWEQNMREDLLEMLKRCDKVALLPGWENSRGVNLERDIALALGFKVYALQVWFRGQYELSFFPDGVPPPGWVYTEKTKWWAYMRSSNGLVKT